MSVIKTFTAGEMTINAAMPSALEQDEILSLVSVPFIAHAGRVYADGGELTVKNVVLMLTAIPFNIKTRIAEVLLSKAFVASTKTRVTVNDFSGKMMTLNTLLAELFLWIYSDFFDYVQNANKSE